MRMEILSFLYFLDPGYMLIMLGGALVSGIAAMRVKSTFSRYAKVGTASGMSGAEAADAVLRAASVPGVRIEAHQGFLSDHYDPRSKTLRLSPQVYSGRSISAVAVGAHEAGHAIQDARNYAPLRLRTAIVPLASFGSRLWTIPLFLGMMLNASGLMMVGVVLFAGVVLFQLVTLPTEFDASRRAKEVLASTGVVRTTEETAGVSRVLNAAAMTYVAAALTSIVQLLYFLSRATRS